GLNTSILQSYVEYITNVRLKALNLDPIFPQKGNPLPWMNNWLVSDNVQVAPQESEISSYLVGQVNSKVSKDDFGDFSL
ncbi:MAG TPA: ribonucleotide-diphosphate reductase subunit beta, partial [Thiomicrospira sp.]